jgi:hypothetical protein
MPTLEWLLPVLLIAALVLMAVRLGKVESELLRAEMREASLVDRLTELGVKVIYDHNAPMYIRYEYTEAAREFMQQFYFPSSWNLDRQLDYEADQRRQKEEAQPFPVDSDAA